MLLRILPTGWVGDYVRFDRDRQRPPASSALRRMLRDSDLIGYYLPLGWPLLTLARRFRRPPYGYRGLDTTERKRREGIYLWRLSERPLPPRDDL